GGGGGGAARRAAVGRRGRALGAPAGSRPLQGPPRAIAALPAGELPALGRGAFRKRLRNLPIALVFLAPALTILGIFSFYPLFYSVYISVHRWRLLKGPYIGLDNYRQALETREFWDSFVNTAWFALFTVPITMIVGLTLA